MCVLTGADGRGGASRARPQVLREYLTPAELDVFSTTGRYPEARKLCLLCERGLELEKFIALVKAAEDYVFSLKIGQLLSHLDMEIVFKCLPNLSNLELSYG